MYPRAQKVMNIWGLKRDPILTHLILKEQSVCVCQSSSEARYTHWYSIKIIQEDTCAHVEAVRCSRSSLGLAKRMQMSQFVDRRG